MQKSSKSGSARTLGGTQQTLKNNPNFNNSSHLLKNVDGPCSILQDFYHNSVPMLRKLSELISLF